MCLASTVCRFGASMLAVSPAKTNWGRSSSDLLACILNSYVSPSASLCDLSWKTHRNNMSTTGSPPFAFSRVTATRETLPQGVFLPLFTHTRPVCQQSLTSLSHPQHAKLLLSFQHHLKMLSERFAPRSRSAAPVLSLYSSNSPPSSRQRLKSSSHYASKLLAARMRPVSLSLGG